MGYYDSAEFYGVYIWEYLNVIVPMLDEAQLPSDVRAWLAQGSVS